MQKHFRRFLTHCVHYTFLLVYASIHLFMHQRPAFFAGWKQVPACLRNLCATGGFRQCSSAETKMTGLLAGMKGTDGTVVKYTFRSSKNTPSAAFLTRFAPFAYEPTARRAANGDRNPLLRKGSETTGRVSKANRGVRTAQSASATPKPKTDRRLGLGRNARRWFRISNQRAAALRYLQGFFNIYVFHPDENPAKIFLNIYAKIT